MTQQVDKEIDIQLLEFPHNVRTRPGMFIGSTENPDVILREAIDNASDELMGSLSCNYVDIQIKSGQQGGWYIVADNGRGIPIIWDDEKHCTKTELAVANLNAGSKFNKTSDNISAGMNGVGISCTNALSTRFVILSKITEQNYNKSIPVVESTYNQLAGTDELFYVLEFEKGIKVWESATTKLDAIRHYNFSFPEKMSTIVAFIPDPIIWKSVEARYSSKSLSYLHVVLDKFYNKQVTLVIDGEKISNTFKPFKYEFLKEVSVPSSNAEHPVKSCRFYVNFECSTMLHEQDYSGSVNSLIVDRGVHIRYLKDAWVEALVRKYSINPTYATSGLNMNVIAICGEADFSSQTKENCVKLDDLYSSETTPILCKEFIKIFDENKDYFDDHVYRLNEYISSLIHISTINKIKSMVVVDDGSNTRVRSKIPSNVKDASSTDRKQCELYIVEGRSASGTILKTRNSSTQAVMELRGIPMNAVNRELDELFENEEMRSIISAIGVGVNEYHDLSNPRYGKVIIAADADADGGKIASLLLGFFAKKMTFMIKAGMVYVLDSPLYLQNNKYIFPTDDIDSVLDKSKPFNRFKGLGELNTDDAKRVLVGDERRLIKINLGNVEYALSLLTSTSARKDLIINKGLLNDPYNTGIY